LNQPFRPPAAIPCQESILDLMDTAVISLDGHDRILVMNSAAEHCLCVGRERAMVRPLADVASIPKEMLAAVRQCRESESGMRLHDLELGGGQYDCTLQPGERGTVLLELQNLEWEHKRHRLEQRELQTGLLELLSRNLGHEIRNPLGGIRGASQMLASELASPEMANLARLIMREVDRIDELIQSFGQPKLAEEPVQFYPLLDEVIDLVEIEFSEQAVFERDFDPSIPVFAGDAMAIRQVLLNLMRNALQAQSTRVVIRTRVEHGGALLQSATTSLLRIDVVDDGEGVPESLRNLLFLPLVTGKRNGTGLGLALSQQIAAAHGGLLSYEPVRAGPGGGSRFSLYLPLSRNLPQPVAAHSGATVMEARS
jgi:two-component system, NtrC family, nitrogen regulation sensor histidine kinase GlnL